VLAKSGNRASMLIVEKGMKGFVVNGQHVLTGFKAGDVSNLAFNDCRLPKENLIGEEGAGLALTVAIFTANRPAVGAVGLGLRMEPLRLR
jgi:alkylation response protein AidB-like acyl-CoA dehydrogenase